MDCHGRSWKIFSNFPSSQGSARLPGGLADVDVSLGGEHQGEPDAGVVPHLRRRLRQHLKQEARGAAPVHVHVAAIMSINNFSFKLNPLLFIFHNPYIIRLHVC